MGYKVSNACCVTYETYCSVLLSIVSGMQIFLISIFLSDCRFMRKTSLWLKDAAEGDDLWRLEYVRENLDPSCCSSLLTWTTSTSLTFGNMLSIESGCERIIPKERVRQVRRWRSQHMRTVSVNFARYIEENSVCLWSIFVLNLFTRLPPPPPTPPPLSEIASKILSSNYYCQNWILEIMSTLYVTHHKWIFILCITSNLILPPPN